MEESSVDVSGTVLSSDSGVGTVEFGTLVLVSGDDRRDIREIEFRGDSLQDFLVKGVSGPLGQHFHRNKFEVFYFLAGGGTVRAARVDDDGRLAGEITEINVGPGTAIRLPPMFTHRFDLQPGTRFIAFSSQPCDPSDLNPCPIE